ncbi:MAG: helix-turn-helix domain-containing protein [Paracoccaceae bacterium]
MIGRRPSKPAEPEVVEPKGFDDFHVRLGDVMRGERATIGKSLLDVQRELRIKAAYIAAIENCDPEAFDTPGFIAGYVRSYARYLNMDPDVAFDAFCAESGFEVAHGMAAEASSLRKPSREDRLKPQPGRDMFAAPATPFVPTGEALLSRVEPGAIGSMLVLVGLIGAIGYGGWAVLQEVQRVQVAPVEQTPVVLSDLDPLAGSQSAVGEPNSVALDAGPDTTSNIEITRSAALDRLYRPQALDVPVLIARDAPIATLDPTVSGAFAQTSTSAPPLVAGSSDFANLPNQAVPGVPQVVEDLGPTIRMVAAYPSWVRVRSVEGNTLFEGIMEPGDTWDIPATEAPPTLRTGESGAIYFAMGSDCFGPVGLRGQVTKNFPLERTVLADALDVVVPEDSSSALNRMFADLSQVDAAELPRIPCQGN